MRSRIERCKRSPCFFADIADYGRKLSRLRACRRLFLDCGSAYKVIAGGSMHVRHFLYWLGRAVGRPHCPCVAGECDRALSERRYGRRYGRTRFEGLWCMWGSGDGGENDSGALGHRTIEKNTWGSTPIPTTPTTHAATATHGAKALPPISGWAPSDGANIAHTTLKYT
jgi:hypothetical protein